MSWQAWHTTAPPPVSHGMVPLQSNLIAGAVNAAPSLLPPPTAAAAAAAAATPNMQYSPEQWAQMQQQNWQQWAQWQQQYQQWHQQYGAEYQKSIGALSAPPATPIAPTNTSVPPPPPNESKPPPPPPPDDTISPNQYTTAPPPFSGGYSTQPSRPQDYVGGVQTNQPPPNWQYSGNKRPLQHGGEMNDYNKRQMTEAPAKEVNTWQTQPPPSVSQSQAQKNINLEELSEAEKKFDKEFAAWEAQFNKWKDQNANHPDKTQYREYEKKWESWRNSLVERREQMRKKRVALQASIATQRPVNKPTPEQPILKPQAPKQETYLEQKEQLPPPNIEPPNQQSKSEKPESDFSNSFLKSSSTSGGGIPGLDLVKEGGGNEESEEEVEPKPAEAPVASKGAELDAISKGINSILGDPKLLDMLSKVTKPQNVAIEQPLVNTPPPKVPELVQPPKKPSAPIPSLLSMPLQRPNNFSSNYDEGPANQATISNFDDQTRMSFSNGRNDPDFDYNSSFSSARSDKANFQRFGKPLINNNALERPSDGFHLNTNRPTPERPSDGFHLNTNRPTPERPSDGFHLNTNRPPPERPSDGFHLNTNRPPPERPSDGFHMNTNRPPPERPSAGFNMNTNRPPPERPSAGFNMNTNRPPPERPSPGFHMNTNRPPPERPSAGFRPNTNRPAPNFNNRFQEERFSNKPGSFNDFHQNDGNNFQEQDQYEGDEEEWKEEDEFDKYHSMFNEQEQHMFNEPEQRMFNKPEQRMFNKPEQRMFNEPEKRMFNKPEQRMFNEPEKRMFNKPEQRMFNEPEQRMFNKPEQRMFDEPEQHSMEAPSHNAQPLISEPPPAVEDEVMFVPEVVVDYEHKSTKEPELEVAVEMTRMFDYRHKPVNRIPYPQRPIWLSSALRNIQQFDPLGTGRFSSTENTRFEREPNKYYKEKTDHFDRRQNFDERENNYGNSRFSRDAHSDREPNFRRDNSRSDYNPNRHADNKVGRENVGNRRGYNEENRFEQKLDLEELSDEEFVDENPAPNRVNLIVPQPSAKGASTANMPIGNHPSIANFTQNITLDDLISIPGRYNRPAKIVIILRGPPGSGKTFLAKLIKDKEVEHGGSAPRILSLDDYFMVEREKDGFVDGKPTKIKEMFYEYEAEMEESYRQSLIKAYKKTITDGYFHFIIIDNVNQRVKNFGEMWSFAKQNGFQVYICQLDLDPDLCIRRNIHERSESYIEDCIAGWEPTPAHHPMIDPTNFLQNVSSITEVEMEEAEHHDY